MGSPVQGRRTTRSRLPEKAARSALLAGEAKHGVKQALFVRIVLVSVVIGTDHEVFVVEQARRDGDVPGGASSGCGFARRGRGGRISFMASNSAHAA